jgi:hypothetical protein
MENDYEKNYHSTPTMSNVLGCDGMTQISKVFARYNTPSVLKYKMF